MSLGVYIIRYERSSDKTWGDSKYHTPGWRNIIFKRVKEYDLTVNVDTVENSLQEAVRKMTNTMEPMYYVILTDIESGVSSNLQPITTLFL